MIGNPTRISKVMENICFSQLLYHYDFSTLVFYTNDFDIQINEGLSRIDEHLYEQLWEIIGGKGHFS